MTDSLQSTELPAGTPEERIQKALAIAVQFGGTDGAHHKEWTIDQMVRALTGCPLVQNEATDVRGTPYSYRTQGESPEYQTLVANALLGDGGMGTYTGQPGIAP
jgi:hypothetical protein